MKRRTFSKSVTQILPFPFAGRRSSSLFFILLAASSLVFSALNPQGASLIQAKTLDLMAPVLNSVTQPFQSGAEFVRNVSGIATLQAENERLTQENIKLKQWYHQSQSLISQNEALNDLLNVKIPSQNKFVTARILTDSGSRFAKSFLVMAGMEDGVQKSQAVVSDSGVVGRIVSAGEKVSRVLLLTDINSRVPVYIENTQTHAILAGQNDSNPNLMHVPDEVKVETGAMVLTSGKGGVFPPGLPIGKVVKIDDTYKTELFADFSRIMYVRIIEEAPNHSFVQKQ